MRTNKLAKQVVKPFDLRRAVQRSPWGSFDKLAEHIGCHVNTLFTAARYNRLPKNRMIASAVRTALGIKAKP